MTFFANNKAGEYFIKEQRKENNVNTDFYK